MIKFFDKIKFNDFHDVTSIILLIPMMESRLARLLIAEIPADKNIPTSHFQGIFMYGGRFLLLGGLCDVYK